MDFLRATLRALFVVITSASLATLISVATMQATILNRSTVLRWMENSGIYQNIVNIAVQLQPDSAPESQQFLGETTIRDAINQTLDPAFLRTSTEKIINSTYDWLEGKSETITFSIPLSEKRDLLKQNLAKQIEPKISSLPTCSSNFSGVTSQQVQCIPKNSNAQTYAADLASRAVDSSDFLVQPLTQQNIQLPTLPAVNVLRFLASNLQIIISGLAVLAVLSATGYVLLSKDKLRGIQAVGRRAFFGTLILVIGGGVLWYFSNKLTLSAFGDQAIITSIVDPLARQIAADVGMWLFIFSGIVFATGGLIWLGAFLTIKNLEKKLKAAHAGPPKDLPPIGPAAI
ncbi:MAG TPA: hypothetical protein VLA77_00695 [Candidatus Saccharimonadales bacterium]|nr:hypothetical protein [Candidatus Saccharimonadales bacterium]